MQFPVLGSLPSPGNLEIWKPAYSSPISNLVAAFLRLRHSFIFSRFFRQTSKSLLSWFLLPSWKIPVFNESVALLHLATHTQLTRPWLPKRLQVSHHSGIHCSQQHQHARTKISTQCNEVQINVLKPLKPPLAVSVCSRNRIHIRDAQRSAPNSSSIIYVNCLSSSMTTFYTHLPFL